MTTHLHAVGRGRKNSARIKLKNILPAGVGVGSGFVIDSYGNTSQQCDIIYMKSASCEISAADFPWRAEETLQALVS